MVVGEIATGTDVLVVGAGPGGIRRCYPGCAAGQGRDPRREG
jgi:hypothetical protein